MKHILFFILFLMLLSYQSSVFSQDNKGKKEVVTTEEQVAPEMNVYNNKLTIKNAPVGKKVLIFTIIGNKISEISITNSDFEQELKIPKGFYVFKIDATSVIRKVVIK